jgi:threonine dehydrogenase-like Zn-dependent dehydrogenase
VHTAAASNLGQMLNRLCRAETVPLVNIVRSAAQEKLLRDLGAKHVCNSASPDFIADLTRAVRQTGATLAFDAIGGGPLASQILAAMEAAANADATTYSRYGSTVHKQVYIYGMLDQRPTELYRNFGMIWGVGGWLLFPFLMKLTAADRQRLRDRVAADLKTIFASHYSQVISLAEALNPDVIAAYSKRATGEKYLIDPSM